MNPIPLLIPIGLLVFLTAASAADIASTTSSTSSATTTTTTMQWTPYLVIGSGRGTSNGYLYEPREVDVVDDAVYVVEGYGRVQKFSLDGGYIESYGSPGEDDGGLFDEPSGVAFRKMDENTSLLYVSDTKNHRIQIHWRYVNGSETSENWTYFGEKMYSDYYPSSHIYFSQPAGLEVDTNGVIYVANTGMNRISMFASYTNYTRVPGPKNRTEFDGSGTPEGPLSGPRGVAVYNNTVYVADTENNLIRLFNRNGTQILSFGGSGSGRGRFSSPGALSVDESGNIFIADTGNNRVEVYTSQGMYVAGFGSINCTSAIYHRPLLALGQFCSPQGIEAYNGSLYVADTGNYRVQVYNISILPEPTCILPGDNPPCRQVSISEVIDSIRYWSIGKAELPDVVAMINLWAAGS